MITAEQARAVAEKLKAPSNDNKTENILDI